MTSTSGDVTLRIVLEQPPPGVDFGLQKGRGSQFETVQTQQSSGGDLSFEFAAGVGEGGKLRGPFVQGPPAERFVYLRVGAAAGQAGSPWSRRVKVPLAGISRDAVERAQARTHVIEAHVPGTGRDGTPACATVKDFDGWKLRPWK
jgi:Family of unknown function (DUF5990)